MIFYRSLSLDYVWALTTDRQISSSDGRELAKPRQVQFLTHATLVPNNSSKSKISQLSIVSSTQLIRIDTVLWSLDKSCGVYVRPDLEQNTEWEQANQIQFSKTRQISCTPKASLISRRESAIDQYCLQ